MLRRVYVPYLHVHLLHFHANTYLPYRDTVDYQPLPAR